MSGDAGTEVAGSLGFADQPHGRRQEFDHRLPRPIGEWLAPVDVGGLGELRQDRSDGAGVPRFGIEAAHAHNLLGVDLLCDGLFGAGRDPAEQDSSN